MYSCVTKACSVQNYNFPIVLYCCTSRCVTQSEQPAFDSGVLGKIHVSTRGDWRELHKEELHDLHCILLR
jgi:hypothetical protein